MQAMSRPLIVPFIGLIIGVLAGNHFNFPYYFLLGMLIFILISLLLLLRKQRWAACFCLIFCIALITGIFNIQKRQYLDSSHQSILQYADAGRKTVEGIVVESPSYYPDKNVLIVHCLRLIENGVYIPVTGRIRLVLPLDLSFAYGDFIRFHTSLKQIHRFQNPGGFDYERYLHRQGIYATGYIANGSGIVMLRSNAGSGGKLLLESFRIYLKKIIYENASSPEREIIEAMTLGNQNAIPADIRDDFNKTGLSHLLSISGLHIGMVAAISFFFITLLLKISEYLMLRLNIIKAAAMVAFIMVLLYALTAGMGITVVRSALMALVFLIALILDRRGDLYNTLALAGLIILLFSPEALFDISFQLSFAAVLSIIYIVPRFDQLPFREKLTTFPPRIQGIIRYFYMSVIVCLAATIGTVPLIIFYFNRVSAVTVIANIIIVPLLGTLTLAIAMAFLVTAFILPAVAGFFIQTASLFVWISLKIINNLASFSWSSFTFAKPNIGEIIIFYLFLALFFQLFGRQKGKENGKGFFVRHPLILKYTLVAAVIFLVGNSLYLSLRQIFSTNLAITAVDVGQGSAILVRLPGGKNMLIDGGGFADSSFDSGRMVVAPYLYNERISKIDTVILTHPHPDHLLGLFYIMENFNVREFWSTGIAGDDETALNLRRIIHERGIKTYALTADASIKKNNVEIKILWPPSASTKNKDILSDNDLNDSSLVFQIRYGRIRFLVTGDISTKIEDILVRSEKDLQSDVLFVPHHGSAHSSGTDFINKVASQYAVISVGKNNLFRHPHPLTLARYKATQISLLRTDRDGAITFSTDGISLAKDTFIKNRSN